MCPCTCEYRDKLINWARQIIPNRTYAELLELMKPIIVKIKDELTVAKTTLSIYKRKKTSASDARSSSYTIGLVGISFIVSVFGLLFVADCTNFLQFVLKNCSSQKLNRKTSKVGAYN